MAFQQDDGHRETLAWLRDPEECERIVFEVLTLFQMFEEFGKARLFLELVWDYKARLPRLVPPPDERA